MKYNEDDNKPEFNEEVMIMSRNIKGGFLTLSGVVGIVGMIIAAMQNPATAWVAVCWNVASAVVHLQGEAGTAVHSITRLSGNA